MSEIDKRKILAVMLMVGLFVAISILLQEYNRPIKELIVQTPLLAKEAMEKQLITVNITGAVQNPGLYKLVPDSRVFDLVEKAGGLLPIADKDKVNMARVCYDGMHVNVKEVKVKTSKKERSSKKVVKDNNVIVCINTATEQELIMLPGIGPVLAKNIIEYRQINGIFKTIEQLKDVKGIGKAKFEQLKMRVTL